MRVLGLRSSFTSRADLIEKITGFTIRYNHTAKPHSLSLSLRSGANVLLPGSYLK